MNVKETVKDYKDYLIEMRRWFHQHPEVSMKEYETSKKIKDELDKMGVEWVPCGMETGVLATIKGAKPGKTVLLRADMDALPVKENTGLSFASLNEGVSHACGHDCHISTLLTAAKVLSEHKDELCGTVKFAFQPAEEVGLGAKSMIEAGALEGVDHAFGIHIWSDVPSGMVSLSAGPRMAAAEEFDVWVHGKQGHGSAPHQCIDAPYITSAMVVALQEAVSREMNPFDPVVVTVGKINAGERWNVVGGEGYFEGTVRYYSKEVDKVIDPIIERICRGVADAYRAKVEFKFNKILGPTINEPKTTEVCAEAAKKAIGDDCLFDFPPVTGGEDFSFIADKVPSAFAFVGVRNEACDAVYPHHSDKFKVDEDAIINSVALYVQVAMDLNAE